MTRLAFLKRARASLAPRQTLSPAYKRYGLAMLTTVFTVNLFDRGLMALLLQPIKEDLHLSDTQLGFLTGIAYALFFAILGVPMGRWADRGNRVTIISLVLTLWGLTNMAFVLVGNFVQLLLLRVVAAVGDVGCKPLTYSLLGDYFPESAERMRAMYIWFLAAPLASIISLTAAGWLNEHYGWRQAFFAVGLLGLPLALLVKCTLIEPRTRYGDTSRNEQDPAAPPLKEVFARLWRQPSSRHLTIAIVLTYFVGNGALAWQAAFMIRNHGFGTAELGTWMGMINGMGAIASSLLGRYIVDRWFAQNERGQLKLAGASLAAGAPILVAFLLVPTKGETLALMLLLSMALGICVAPPYVMLQRLVPDNARATALMGVLLLANLIGLGMGPLIVGNLSDLLTPALGNDGLRYAMMAMSVGWLWVAYHYFRVARTIKVDLEQAAQYGAA